MRHKFSHYTFKKSSIRHKTPGYNQDDLYLFYYQLKGYICLCFWFKSTTCWKGRHGLWTVDAWFATNSWLESWSWRWFWDIVIFFWHRCIMKLHIPEWPAWGSLTVIWGTCRGDLSKNRWKWSTTRDDLPVNNELKMENISFLPKDMKGGGNNCSNWG